MCVCICLYFLVLAVCLCISPSSFYYACIARSSVCVYVFLSLRFTNLCFQIFSLYVSVFAWISQTCLYVFVFPVFSLLCIYFPFFNRCVCILQSSVHICLYFSQFSSLVCMSLDFPVSILLRLYFQLLILCVCISKILSLHVCVSQEQSTYVCISQSLVYMWKSPNLVFTCLDIKILILPCLYFKFFNSCGCVSKFSAYMFTYFQICSLYVSSFASFICMTNILFFPPITGTYFSHSSAWNIS
jgi:hypothetical protein